MHSRIAHLSKDKPAEVYMMAEDFYDGFVGWIADYTDDMQPEQVKQEIKDFHEYFEMYSNKIKQEGNKIIFLKGFKEDFANRCIKEIKKIVNSLTSESFLTYTPAYLLEPWLGDQFGLYIYEDGWGTQKLISFMKDLEEETPYYINNIIDYHY